MSVAGAKQGTRRRGFDAVHSSLTAFLKGFFSPAPPVLKVGLNKIKKAKPASCPFRAQCSGPKLKLKLSIDAGESWETDVREYGAQKNTEYSEEAQ